MDIFFLCVMFLTLKFVPNSEECHLPHFQGELCNCRHYLLTIFSFSYNVKTVMLLLALSWGALFPCLLKLQRILDKKNKYKNLHKLILPCAIKFSWILVQRKEGEGRRKGGGREKRNMSKTVCDTAGTEDGSLAEWRRPWSFQFSPIFGNNEELRRPHAYGVWAKWSLNHLFIFTIDNLPAVTCTTYRNGTEGNWLLHCRILSLYVQ